MGLVDIDTKLSWDTHVNHITKKFNRVLFAFRFFRRYTTGTLRKQLAAALLFPHLDYCSIVLIDAFYTCGILCLMKLEIFLSSGGSKQFQESIFLTSTLY